MSLWPTRGTSDPPFPTDRSIIIVSSSTALPATASMRPLSPFSVTIVMPATIFSPTRLTVRYKNVVLPRRLPLSNRPQSQNPHGSLMHNADPRPKQLAMPVV